MCLFISFLTACASPTVKNESIKIKRVILFNDSTRALTNTRIYITETRELFSCGYLLPKTECSTGFPLREYKGNRFDVTWTEDGRQRAVKNILVEVPVTLSKDSPVNAVILFREHGRFSAILKN